MSKLFFRYSAMGAGKSLDVLKVAFNYEERGMQVVLYTTALDSRFGNGVISSRTGITKKAHVFSEQTNFLEHFKANYFEQDTLINCVLVDEAQFSTKHQVAHLRKIVTDYGVPVIAYGLRTDFRGELFEGSEWLLAWADSIEELKTICWCGKKATMNARLAGGKVIKDGQQIMIGGNETYIALCPTHFWNGQTQVSEFERTSP
jgi:thymidine kinase